MASRLLNAVLTAILMKEFEDDQTATIQWLHEQVQDQISAAALKALWNECHELLRNVAQRSLSVPDFEGALPSSWSPEQRQGAVRWYSRHRPRLHAALVSRSAWNPTLTRFQWRADVGVRTRNSTAAPDAKPQPIAIVELETSSTDADQRIVRFEMNPEQVLTAVRRLDQIQQAIEAAASRR